MAYLTNWDKEYEELKSAEDLNEFRRARTFTTKAGEDRPLLELNLARSYQKNILENDEQLVIPIFGQPGSGKSTLMLWIEYFFTGEIDFSTTCFTHDQWAEEATAEEKGKIIKYEEGRQTFVKRRAMGSNNKDGLDILSIYRAKNNIHFINFQNIREVEDDLLFFHADGILWVHKLFGEKGWVSAYSPHTLGKDNVQDKLSENALQPGEHSDLTVSFPRFDKEHPDLWKKYDKTKHENLENIRERYVSD